MSERIIGLVLAGGEGRRLQPLTRTRCKPAVSFGGKFRLVDFVLSNLLNSGITSIYVLAQYLSQSLIEHLRTAWRRQGIRREVFITVVPPQMHDGAMRYRGTADAVRQNLNLVREHRATLVAIFGSDHVYRMDVRQMVRFHRSHGGGITLGAAPVPLACAQELGILCVDGEGRVLDCAEKPLHPAAMAGLPERALASMGVWLIDPDILAEMLGRLDEVAPEADDDKGWMITPALFPPGAVHAYDLRENVLPGVLATEEPAYWRDVGTIQAWWRAHMDLLGRAPRFDLDNLEWPLLAERGPGPSVRCLSGSVEDSLLADGVLLDGASVRRSVPGHDVGLGAGVLVEESVLMDRVRVGAGAQLRRVIVDTPNVIPAGVHLHPGGTRAVAHLFPGGLIEDPSGIVVVPAHRSAE